MTCYGGIYGAVMATKMAPGMVFRHKGAKPPPYGGNQPNPEAVMAHRYGVMARPHIPGRGLQPISAIVQRIVARCHPT